MKTYIAEIIPKIQRFSKKLDNLAKLENQHWVSLEDINQNKVVYIFRANNQLLISDNGLVEKGSWEYLGNQSLLLETKDKSYLLKHGFFDESVIALKLDSTNSYAFFVNETKYDKELNNIHDIITFLEKKYLKVQPTVSMVKTDEQPLFDKNANYTYEIISETELYKFSWGYYTKFEISHSSGQIAHIYKGKSSSSYFIDDNYEGRRYCDNLDDAIYRRFFRKEIKPT